MSVYNNDNNVLYAVIVSVYNKDGKFWEVLSKKNHFQVSGITPLTVLKLEISVVLIEIV